ncbi:multidrug resistance-associated protein 4-like [Contarinia nasturtii]|uniref:multidrug resistance-associated protein 4-like n=1 Tax=Contarinia nasturtii TaxID=265458 RepID=UPI0012D3907D|nr:multidrug resistance-associated protein 4-like [Contarinia nasturtii]XP_031635713.1 multidrug resistance-associated protein 4-like [Contarinia nasturtii]
MDSVKIELKENPRDGANIFSVLFFAWVYPLLKEGSSKPLETEDIFQSRQCDKSKVLADKLQRFWDQEQNEKKCASLFRAIAKTFWKEYLVLALLCLVNDVILKIAQPQLFRRFLQYFKSKSEVSHNEAVLYAGGMVVLSGLGVLTINQLFMTGYYNGMKVRVAVGSILYRKALRVSHATLENTSHGKIMNILSNDVFRFDAMSMFINAMWTAPLLVVTVGYLLWIEIKWAGMLGLLVVFVIVPIQSYSGKLSVTFRNQTAKRTDERIRLMDEIISGIHMIKLMAWQKHFTNLIALARKFELKVVRKNSYVRALYMTFAMFTTRIALFCSLLSIIFLYGEQDITAAKVFVVSSYFSVIAQTLSQMFVRGITEIAEGLVAVERIQSFLESEEKVLNTLPSTNTLTEKNPEEQFHRVLNNIDSENFTICTRKMNARWTPSDQMSFNLSDINLEFRKKGKLIGVTGVVGSGKSSLLQAFLRELPTETGLLTLNGTISYSSQEPWVFDSSIRQNILFGEKFDRKRYEMVVKACDLEKDFNQLEYADQTLIGQKAMLSTGQFSRINLARAAYRKADIYLLDDPLSAVDNHVQLHLFTDCIGPNGILAKQKSTRILVTHHLHFLTNVDWLIVMNDGKISAQGHPHDLNSIEFPLIYSEIDEQKQKQETNENQRRRKVSRVSVKSLSITSMNSEYESMRRESEFDPCLIESLQFYEESTTESQRSSFFSYFQSGAKPIVLFIICLLFILAQLSASGTDYFVSFWIYQEETRHMYNQIALNATARGSTDVLSTSTCIVIYSILVASIFVFALARSISFYNVCIKASQNLHDNMFKALISTSMRFFNLNPPGRILNRFSRDIGTVDESLPKVFLDSIQTNLNMCGAIILTAFVIPVVLIPLSVIAIVFWIIRGVYLKTSKSLKRLESISRSPLYTHMSVSLEGLSTIRAFSAEKILIDEFDRHQDSHTSLWFAFISTSCAFGFALDAMCFVLVFIVIFSFLLFDTGTSGDKVGLAVTQSLTMTSLLQWGIRHSCEVANQLISVERIQEYSDLEAEYQPKKRKEMTQSWPSDGRIEFRNVTYKYAYESEAVLHRISFDVLPKNKIGVVGRTGAGKSSLIGALFRMAYVKGEILIDGVNTETIDLQLLRSNISIIPQTPLLFSGTLRQNLDPLNEHSDDEIYSALDDIKMRHIACGSHGLDLNVLANGGNFSNGQRQILCLARAILQKNTILVLDEATANVDSQTDELIQQTIRTKFADHTVLTIAHRLNTIIDYDRVLVIDAGKCVEYDRPYNLLTKTSGYFKEMVQALGHKEFERFLEIAKTKQL